MIALVSLLALTLAAQDVAKPDAPVELRHAPRPGLELERVARLELDLELDRGEVTLGGVGRIDENMQLDIRDSHWFHVRDVYAEDGEPLGQVYRSGEGAVPSVGARLDDDARWKSAEVVEFSELRATCSMRRFRVVLRVI